MSVTTQKKQQQQVAQNNAAVAAANAGQQAPQYQQMAATPQYQQTAVSAPTVNTTSASTKSYNIPDIQSPANYTWGTDPGSYTNRYQAAMDGIMNQIKNKKKFKYEFNGDALFKAYKDLYTQNGKQAMQDTMGNAAQLTGGYGNSYAQNVGQQTYQQYMTQLHDIGLQLRDRAYQMNQDELANLFNLYQMYQDAEAADYARYKDAYSAYQDALAAEAASGRRGRRTDDDEKKPWLYDYISSIGKGALGTFGNSVSNLGNYMAKLQAFQNKDWNDTHGKVDDIKKKNSK